MLNIIDTMIRNDNFSILADAINSADLEETLKKSGPFTLFAPEDDAFAKIDPMIMTGLIADTSSLNKILLYHIVIGRHWLVDLAGLIDMPSMEGSDIFIHSNHFEIKVNDALITHADIECLNGVIHSIDSVIFPPVVEF